MSIEHKHFKYTCRPESRQPTVLLRAQGRLKQLN